HGDLGWVLAHLDPGIVWEDARQMPDARVYRGLGGARSFLRSFGRHWEEIRFEPEELREVEDSVIAFVRPAGRGTAAGADGDARAARDAATRGGGPRPPGGRGAGARRGGEAAEGARGAPGSRG